MAETMPPEGSVQPVSPVSRTLNPLRTGFHDLDNLLALLDPTPGLLVLAGRPCIGKTTLAHNIARDLALGRSQGVIIFSMEMGRKEVLARLLAIETRIDTQRILTRLFFPEEHEELVRALAVLDQAPLTIDDRAQVTVAEIARVLEDLARTAEAPALAIVDYAQLLAREGRDGLPDEEGQLRRLRALAHDLSIPVLLLAQLPLTASGQSDHTTRLALAGRYQGDAVLLLRMNEPHDYPRTGRAMADVTVAVGVRPVGSCRLRYEGSCGRFSDVA